MEKRLVFLVALILFSGCLGQAPTLTTTPIPTTTPPPTISPTLDTDKDDITDVLEKQYGTNINAPTFLWDLNSTENAIAILYPSLQTVDANIESFMQTETYPYDTYWNSLKFYKGKIPEWKGNVTNALSHAEEYEKDQEELKEEFSRLLDTLSSSISEEKKLEYIRSWNATHTIDEKNDSTGKLTIYNTTGSIYREIVDMMKKTSNHTTRRVIFHI